MYLVLVYNAMSQVNKKHQSGNFFRSTLALERNLLKCLLLHLKQSEMVMAFFPHHSCLFHPYDITFTNKTFCPACTVWLLSTVSRSRVALFSRIFHAFTFSSNILATSLFLFRAQQISSLFALKIANGNASVCPQETSKKATMQRDGHRIYFLSWLEMSFENCENNSCFIRFMWMCVCAFSFFSFVYLHEKCSQRLSC